MSNTTTTAETAIREPRGRRLAEKSALFQLGALSGEISDESYILRLNTIVARRSKGAENKVPAELADAVTSKGELDRHAELVAFGHWLLLEGRPGAKRQGGKQPDLRTILKCVAVAMYELRVRPKLQEHGLAPTERESRTRDITKHDLAERWRRMLGERKEVSFFDARLRSMMRILPAYLKHLKSETYVIDGKQVKKSPQIEKVMKAISGRYTTKREEKASMLTKPLTLVPATLVPFEITLRYSSPAHEEEYRNRVRVPFAPSNLRYIPTPVSSTSASREVRADRKDKIILMPDIAIRDNYKVEALIDRMVILVNTNIPTAPHYLNDKIFKATGAKVFAQDLHRPVNTQDWRAALPKPDFTKTTGHHFAILIQDPAPELLTTILKVIGKTSGIVGKVNVHLIEVSVDFYPRSNELPKATMLREQIVGLLQRHHWARHSLFESHRLSSPRNADARQYYAEQDTKTKTDFFFADATRNKSSSDRDVDNLDVRKRLLTNRPGRDLYLNSTVWKGAENSPNQVSIQHKIADRRNPEKQTKEDLPDQLRRARIEVTISGRDALRKKGLETVDDLESVPFRKLAKPFLTFKLAVSEPFQHLVDDAKAQMRTRGVYGIELRGRALALEKREEQRNTGQKLDPNTDRPGRGLQSWPEMNDVVGKALDELSRRWSGFSWK